MNISQISPVALLVFGSLALGCGPAGPLPDGLDRIDAPGEAVAVSGFVSTNDLPDGLLGDASYAQALVALAASSLLNAQGDLNATPLTDPSLFPEGITLLKYVLRCALPPGPPVKYDTNMDGVGDTEIPSGPNIGLAAPWATQLLGVVEQQWMTACLLAHANAYDVEVPILLSGVHAALVSQDGAGFDFQEATYYGNLFQTNIDINGKALPNKLACIGASPNQACNAAAFSQWLMFRVCGNSPECGFKVFTSCSGTKAPICEEPADKDEVGSEGAGMTVSVIGDTAESYEACSDGAGMSASWYKPITVYLIAEDAAVVYPPQVCDLVDGA